MKTTVIQFNTVEYAAALAGAAQSGVTTVEEYIRELMRKQARELTDGGR